MMVMNVKRFGREDDVIDPGRDLCCLIVSYDVLNKLNFNRMTNHSPLVGADFIIPVRDMPASFPIIKIHQSCHASKSQSNANYLSSFRVGVCDRQDTTLLLADLYHSFGQALIYFCLILIRAIIISCTESAG